MRIHYSRAKVFKKNLVQITIYLLSSLLSISSVFAQDKEEGVTFEKPKILTTGIAFFTSSNSNGMSLSITSFPLFSTSFKNSELTTSLVGTGKIFESKNIYHDDSNNKFKPITTLESEFGLEGKTQFNENYAEYAQIGWSRHFINDKVSTKKYVDQVFLTLGAEFRHKNETPAFLSGSHSAFFAEINLLSRELTADKIAGEPALTNAINLGMGFRNFY